jgi:hypothetical protein
MCELDILESPLFSIIFTNVVARVGVGEVVDERQK